MQQPQPDLPVDGDVADPAERVPTVLAATSSVLRLRGLPFSATEQDIREFFKAFTVHSFFVCKRNGRATGEAYVQLDSASSATKALQELNRQHMGHRYIEIFDSSEADMSTAKAMSIDRLKGYVVRARGLPYSASASDVLRFFSGLDIVRGMEGVVFTYTPDGRPTGELYVEFQDEESQKEAMKKHKETMGSRYIELFVSTKADMLQAIQHNRMILGYANRKRWLETQGGPQGLGLQHGGGMPHMMFGMGPGGTVGGVGHGGMLSGAGMPGGIGGGVPRGHHPGGYGPAVDDMTELFSGFNLGLPQQRGVVGGNQMQYGVTQQPSFDSVQAGDVRGAGGAGRGAGGRGAGSAGRYGAMGGGAHDAAGRGHTMRPGTLHHPQHPHHPLMQPAQLGYSPVLLQQQMQSQVGHSSPMQQQPQQVGQAAYLMQQQSQQFDRSGTGQYDPNMYLVSGVNSEANPQQQQQQAYFAAAAAAAAAGNSSRAYYATTAATGQGGNAAHSGQYYPMQGHGGSGVGVAGYVSPAAAAAAYSMGTAAGSRGLEYAHLGGGTLQSLEPLSAGAAGGNGGSSGLQRFDVTGGANLRGVADGAVADGGNQLDYSVAS